MLPSAADAARRAEEDAEMKEEQEIVKAEDLRF